jgi:hypothetical protein
LRKDVNRRDCAQLSAALQERRRQWNKQDGDYHQQEDKDDKQVKGLANWIGKRLAQQVGAE